MKKFDLKIYFFFILAIVLAIVFFIFSRQAVKGSDSIIMTVKISVCGNGVKEYGEDCDNSDLGGKSCSSLGYSSGTLTCDVACDYVTSACVSASPGGGGGTGSGGGSGNFIPPSYVTGVILSGRAYPLSQVVVLKDGQIAANTIAGPDSNFSVSLTGLSAGSYNFAVYGIDNQQRRSTLFTFPTYINTGSTLSIGGIFIAPTIDVDKKEVKQGDNIAIFGQSVPSAKITVNINSENNIFGYITADNNGVYLYNYDTSPLDRGGHSARSKSAVGEQISSYGQSVSFTVGDKNIDKPVDNAGIKGDINNDGKVNLVDFSVAAYWYKRSGAPAKVDLNSDGKVDLIDFSILAYHWTG